MQTRTIAALALCGVMVGCATPPNNIKPTDVNAARYAGRSCAQLDAELAKINSDLAPLLVAQDRTSTNDAAGMFWIGVPLGSMTDKADIKAREAKIADMKGQMAGINAAREKRGCIVAKL